MDNPPLPGDTLKSTSRVLVVRPTDTSSSRRRGVEWTTSAWRGRCKRVNLGNTVPFIHQPLVQGDLSWSWFWEMPFGMETSRSRRRRSASVFEASREEYGSYGDGRDCGMEISMLYRYGYLYKKRTPNDATWRYGGKSYRGIYMP